MYMKRQLSASELVNKMKDEEGITFKYVKEEDAETYLEGVNNYFRTACYRKNFNKYSSGSKKGKYINLDFLHLQELSVLDMHFRHLVYKMCLDIEHALKVYIVSCFDRLNIDEYEYVDNFLSNEKYTYIKQNIRRLRSSSYCGKLVKKYFTFGQSDNSVNCQDCPVWVLVEILTFGNLISFYFFCQKKLRSEFGDENLQISESDLLNQDNVINLIRSLRNGCAHNNCLFENLKDDASVIPPRILKERVELISSISKSARQKRLRVRVILEFTALLLMYNDIVSTKVKYHRFIEMNDYFSNRMMEKGALLKTNATIQSDYKFIKTLVNYIVDKK